MPQILVDFAIGLAAGLMVVWLARRAAARASRWAAQEAAGQSSLRRFPAEGCYLRFGWLPRWLILGVMLALAMWHLSPSAALTYAVLAGYLVSPLVTFGAKRLFRSRRK